MPIKLSSSFRKPSVTNLRSAVVSESALSAANSYTAMKRLSLLVVLLCASTSLVYCQQPTKISTTPKPDEGSFVQNTYRNDFFGFSYALPREWHKSRVVPAALPPGAYYLFIGDRYTEEPLLSRVMVVADPESHNRPGLSTQEYLSAYIRAQVSDFKAEVIREPSSFVSGETNSYRADYKWVENGTTFYSSMVCTKRNSYWLSWSFVTPSQRDLDDAVSTLQRISFDPASPR
jgi:hypothetical protein